MIKFSHDYPKLASPMFPTIRRWTEDKEAYYRRLVGSVLPVEVCGTIKGHAMLLAVERYTVCALPTPFLNWDTNDGQYRLDPNMRALLLVFAWV